jgi:signal transduction histidine kinase
MLCISTLLLISEEINEVGGRLSVPSIIVTGLIYHFQFFWSYWDSNQLQFIYSDFKGFLTKLTIFHTREIIITVCK